MPLSPDLLSRFSAEISRYSDVRRRHLLFVAGKGSKPTTEEYKWVSDNGNLLRDIQKGREPMTEDEKPAGFEAHVDAVRSLLGGESAWKPLESQTPESLGLGVLLDPANFERLSKLTPEEVTAELDRIPYVAENFPAETGAADTALGLTRFRPSWWGQVPDVKVGGVPVAPTWGLAYLRSVASELGSLRGATVLVDAAVKPNYADGSQHYGSAAGDDASLDPLLPLFREAFKDAGNRFSRSYDGIVENLLPLVRDKLAARFASLGLPDVPFGVTLVPFLADQRFMVSDSPESSSTNTWEWTSTPLVGASGAEAGRRLVAGYSGDGGAGCVFDNHPSVAVVVRGARLAVVFRH